MVAQNYMHNVTNILKHSIYQCCWCHNHVISAQNVHHSPSLAAQELSKQSRLSRGVDIGLLWAIATPTYQPQKVKENKYGKCTRTTQFCGVFINFWPIFVIFRNFPQRVIIVPKMPDRSPINFTRTSDSGKTGS